MWDRLSVKEGFHLKAKQSSSFLIQDLTDHIVDQWQTVGRHLNLPPGTVTVLKANHAGDLKEVIYRMLMSWKQDAGFGATYEALALALHKAHRKDLAQLVCKGEKKRTYV